jgi:uncharacterized membrane protein
MGAGGQAGLGPAAALGVATGMRTFTGAAVLALSQRGGDGSGVGVPAVPSASAGDEGHLLPLMRSPLVAAGLGLAAAVELVADKVPGIPARIAPGPLTARALMGAALGWTVGRRGDRVAAALVGGAAAVAAAGTAYAVRRWLTREHGLPDFAVAVLEDAAALAAARAAARRTRGGPAVFARNGIQVK